jgi:hypothetical protein
MPTLAPVRQLTGRAHTLKHAPRTSLTAMRLGVLLQQGVEFVRSKPLHGFSLGLNF